MRLTFKIMAAVLLVFAVLQVIYSYLVVQREVALFRADMDLHAYLLGSVLATSVADIWKANGPERVASVIRDANRSEHLVQVRWVWFGVPPGNPRAPRAKIDDLSSLRSGRELLLPDYTYNGEEYHLAYFPVAIENGQLSALELSQPLARMHHYIQVTIFRRVGLFVIFLIVGGMLVWVLGIRLVGRPVDAMVQQARAVGEGDLEARNNLERVGDEIGVLARRLNEMTGDLRVARDRLEEESSRRIAAMEQLNHAERLATVGKLASGLAHELGTPLNVVAGRAKMIASEDMEAAEVLDSATVIQSQAERMTAIIRQLLDFARSRPAEKRLEPLAKPATKVVHMLSPIASQHHVDISLEEGDHEPDVQMEVSQIQQVLSNLVMNAIHAMPQGGTIKLSYGTRVATPPADLGGEEAEYGFIDVVDSGVGISQENLTRIFAPFFSTKEVGEGTGLGLSIAHSIVHEHRGWLAVESTVGAGSRFTVYLPLGKNS
jgi:signal transduction histidine kinase